MPSPQHGILFLLFSALRLVQVVEAGAGARVQACYYASTTPVAPILVSFNAGGSGSHCLNNVGQSRTLIVSQSGVNCVDSGYVEGKDSSTGGDNCAVESSIWTLSYSTNSTGESGSMSSRWQSGWLTDNKVTLQKQSKGTVVCGQASLCDSTSIHWAHGSDTLYFIFNPSATSMNLEL